MKKDSSKPVRILIVEDKEDQWELITKVIERCFTSAITFVVHTITPDETLEFLKTCLFQEWNMPNLILLDAPNLVDGLDLLKQIRIMDSPCKGIPIVMFSDSNIQDDIVRAYNSGISSYCIKPTDFNSWVTLFEELDNYWLNIVSLPPCHYSIF